MTIENPQDAKVVEEAVFDLNEVFESLGDIERAVFGSLIGAATAMDSDILGVDLEKSLDHIKQVVPDATMHDLLQAIDRLQGVVVTTDHDGGVMKTNVLAVVAIIEDKSGNARSMIVAVLLREG